MDAEQLLKDAGYGLRALPYRDPALPATSFRRLASHPNSDGRFSRLPTGSAFPHGSESIETSGRPGRIQCFLRASAISDSNCRQPSA